MRMPRGGSLHLFDVLWAYRYVASPQAHATTMKRVRRQSEDANLRRRSPGGRSTHDWSRKMLESKKKRKKGSENARAWTAHPKLSRKKAKIKETIIFNTRDSRVVFDRPGDL